MEKDLNQQQTLFKFVSIRPPELSNPENEGQRFVNDATLSSSDFYKAVQLAPDDKWEAMKKVPTNKLVFYRDMAVLRTKVGKDYIDAADYLARLTSSFIPEEVYDKIGALKSTGLVPRDLWDNLYYQVVHHDEFYVKETVMQLIVLYNVLVFKERLTKPQFLAALPVVVRARVVLPVELFADGGSVSISAQKGVDPKPLFSKKKLMDDAAILDGRYDMQRNDAAVIELKKLQKDYRLLYGKKYDSAMTDYLDQVAQAYANASTIEKTRTDCSGCVETFYEFENLQLPDFNPTIPPEIDPVQLERDLSPESFHVVKTLDLLKETTYDAIIEGLEQESKRVAKTVFGAVRETEKIVTIGGMSFQARSGSEMRDPFTTENQIPFIVSFKETSWHTGKIQFVLTQAYANAEITSVDYEVTFPGVTTPITGTAFAEAGGNLLGIYLFPDIPNLIIPNGKTEFHLTMTFYLLDGSVADLEVDVTLQGKIVGVATIRQRTNDNQGNLGSTFAPNMFGIRRLGIADYKKVVAEVCCYREAEVSSIENIMQGEFKNRTTTRERIEETTVTTERQTEKENITDTATTERFEMQSEIAKMLHQEKQAGAYANVSGKYGQNTTFELGANFAIATSKDESNRQAVTKSKEITQSATERIVSRFREEVVTKVTERYKEENTHILDNRTGTGNVSGVYRYINAVYKNAILNYGKRLMFEFMVPEPSKLFRLGMDLGEKATDGISELTAPPTPESLGLSNAQYLTETNYFALAAAYNANVEAPPEKYKVVGRAYKGEGKNGAMSFEYNDIRTPQGYKAYCALWNYTMRRSNNNNCNADIAIGNITRYVPKSSAANVLHLGTPTSVSELIYFNSTDERRYTDETVPVCLNTWDVGAFSLQVTCRFERGEELFQNWQLKTYDVIVKAYYDRFAEYNEKVASAQQEGTKSLAANPLFYRDIESGILKKNCVSYLVPPSQLGVQYYTGSSFKDFDITRDAQMDAYAAKAKFLEQAFEWNIMSYTFYPYYWAFKNNWKELFQSESDDPLFRNFIQAGMARVIVSVTPGFEDAVMHFMATGQVWNGGSVPVIGDPLYKSIVDELKEQEYVVEETWETTLPTSLIGLQEKGVSITTVGLPCGDGCDTGDSPFKQNDNELKPPMEVKP